MTTTTIRYDRLPSGTVPYCARITGRPSISDPTYRDFYDSKPKNTTQHELCREALLNCVPKKQILESICSVQCFYREMDKLKQTNLWSNEMAEQYKLRSEKVPRDEIKKLFYSGKCRMEIVRMGYGRSQVFRTLRGLDNGVKPEPTRRQKIEDAVHDGKNRDYITTFICANNDFSSEIHRLYRAGRISDDELLRYFKK